MERGENKSALVKVALCGKCVKKLMWKRQKEKEKGKAATELDLETPASEREVIGAGDVDEEDLLAKRRKKRLRDDIPETHRRRSSRSRSPRRPHTSDIPTRRPPSIPRKFDG